MGYDAERATLKAEFENYLGMKSAELGSLPTLGDFTCRTRCGLDQDFRLSHVYVYV